MKYIFNLSLPILLFYSVSCGILIGGILPIAVTICVVLLLFYFKNQPPLEENVEAVLGSSTIQVIAHRGGATDAPENTLEAIKQAHKNGAHAVELDVEFTSDGVSILMHDETVNRTTNSTGMVKNKTFEEVRSMDASAKHPLRTKFPDAQVPTTEEAIQLSLKLGLKIFFDVKGNADQAIPALLEMYSKYPALYKNAIVCSFWPQITYLIRRADKAIVSACTHRHMDFSRDLEGQPSSLWQRVKMTGVDVFLHWAQYAWLHFLCSNSALLLHSGEVNELTVNYFKARGVRVIVWTPNSAHDKAYFANSLGLSYITDTLFTTHVIDSA